MKLTLLSGTILNKDKESNRFGLKDVHSKTEVTQMRDGRFRKRNPIFGLEQLLKAKLNEHYCSRVGILRSAMIRKSTK